MTSEMQGCRRESLLLRATAGKGEWPLGPGPALLSFRFHVGLENGSHLLHLAQTWGGILARLSTPSGLYKCVGAQEAYLVAEIWALLVNPASHWKITWAQSSPLCALLCGFRV